MLLDLSGRKALVTAIAQQLHLAGAELGVQNPDQMGALFQQLERQWGQLDILVHCLAFANKADLVGDFSGMNDPIFRGCG